MNNMELYSINEAADTVAISADLVDKFITLGLIKTIKDGNSDMLTSYGVRRLSKLVELYESSSFCTENIERALINN